MLGFIQKVRKGTKYEKIERYKVIYNLASICYNDALKNVKVGNVSLYNALSHLVQVPELHINMVIYDHLQFNTKAELDDKAAVYVKSQLEYLNSIINSM